MALTHHMTRAAATLAAALIATSATTAQADDREISIGAGYSDYSYSAGSDGAAFAVQYTFHPFYERGNFRARYATGFDLHETGDIHVGFGVAGRWDMANDWFVDVSVMPGLYFEQVPENDLGSTFEFRSQIGLGKYLANGNAVSLSLAHKSNASTTRFNPGVNSLLLRWHHAY
ncbi:acyloxyacyl hydrolase [Celeribacter sp.]|uniref:acyloxyacyl hydrolase n=1 Tax=Celeribacter sp. TaxID=1890673 RepID=UPI003A9302C9